MIELRSVYFSYSNKDVLKDVNAIFEDGITAVIGPNGAGKTTMLKVSACMHRPKSGQVLIDGVDPWSLDERERLRVRRGTVYVHEMPAMLRGTVLDNVLYGLTLRGMRRHGAELEAMNAMKMLGIASLAGERAKSLSAGQRYRVAIARAIAVKPRNLLLDEPVANLDFEGRETLKEVLLEMKRNGMCVVFSTHDRLFALNVADKAILMESGSVVISGNPSEVLSR